MKRKSVLCLLLAFSLLLCCGCGAAGKAEESPRPIDDKVRSWYEVFVWSYADGDGDGIGDLAGLRGKLDYIESLHCNGIWLMPIMPSPSYHKYDVTDYCAVDPLYGTLDDLRALLEDAHGRGIRIILDLPVNHSSDQHPWFLSAASSPDSPYRDYYNWSDEARDGYTERNGSWYESRFVSSMPDLNLNNSRVREEIREILRFWLTDVGVDGFRLDAVTSYYTGDLPANVDFLDWLGETARAIDPDCFLVAEAWDNLSSIARYAEAGIDSFFTFPVSQAEGYVAKTLSAANRKPGVSWADYMLQLEQTLPAATIPAPFLENHDTGRTVGFTGRDNAAKTKMAGGLLATMRGGIFLYYGQEIGMVGSGEDPNKRIGMLWTNEQETTQPPPGVTRLEYAYPGVSEQDSDPASLLNYYREALALRDRFPAIARGATTVLPCEDARACLLLRQWEESTVLLAINPSRDTVTLALDGDAAAFSVLAASLLTGDEAAALTGETLQLPGYGIAVLTRP